MSRTVGRTIVCALALTPWLTVAVPSGQSTLRSQLVGHWRLVGVEQIVEGRPPVKGPSTVGMISYTADGRMQAQLTQEPRPKVRAAEATAAEARELARYTAYFGTYDVDEATKTVTHHRDGTFGPGERDFVRTIDLTGTRLTLSTLPVVVDGARRHSRITWERLRTQAAAAGYQAAARAAVAGTWELVEHKTTLANGEVRRAFGPTPKGLFFFHADGHTSVQIVNPDRPATPLDKASDDDVRALARTYLAYFGSYDVDPATKKIVVHTTVDLNPMNTGADQIRFYELDGDLMYLQPPASAQAGGGQQVSRITWRRLR
jgi:alkylhydroperoxidase family enzyme